MPVSQQDQRLSNIAVHLTVSVTDPSDAMSKKKMSSLLVKQDATSCNSGAVDPYQRLHLHGRPAHTFGSIRLSRWRCELRFCGEPITGSHQYQGPMDSAAKV